MPLTYSIISVVFLLLSPIFKWYLLHLPQSGRRTPARFDLKGGGRRKETSLQKTVFYMINWWCLRAHVSLLKSRKNQNKTKRGGERANFFLSQSSSRLAHVTSFSYLVLVLQALQESFFKGPVFTLKTAFISFKWTSSVLARVSLLCFPDPDVLQATKNLSHMQRWLRNAIKASKNSFPT